MTREEVRDALKKQIKITLEDVDVDAIDCDLSMRDLGANSLDVIEVVSGTMRDLRLKVPRDELEDINTINQLVEVFLRHAPK